MTLQQVESRCRCKAEELITKYFGNINHEAAIEQPETIGDYSIELPRQIEAEYYDYLKALWAEIAPGDPRTFEQIIDKNHLSEQMTDDDRERLQYAYDDAVRRTLWERITKTNHKDETYYKDALKTYTEELLLALRCDFMEDVKKMKQSFSYPSIIENESGRFEIDEQGMVYKFLPSNSNPFIEEITTIKENYYFETRASIKTLIVPFGVKGFRGHFLRGIKVVERFELPESLVSIGSCDSKHDSYSCVFADCILPTVKLPYSLREIGDFAFGHTHINCLYIPESLKSPYERQFKDSYIGTLYLPKAWDNDAQFNRNGGIEASFISFEGEWGYLCWPSTKIGELKFY